MADVVYKPNDSGIRALLQSDEMLALTESYASQMGASGEDMKPFIGFDRAKTIIYSTDRKDTK
jgi:hypothetical protein